MKTGSYAAFDALNHLPLGIAVVTADGKLLAANRMARDLFEQREGLSLINGTIRTTEETSNDSFYIFLRNASKEPGAVFDLPNGETANCRQHNQQSLLISVARAASLTSEMPADEDDDRNVILFIENPGWRTKNNIHRLEKNYGLTPTEARLASLIAEGSSIAEVAGLLGISIGTARVHLKRIFAKTGTRRQAELVHLIAANSTLV